MLDFDFLFDDSECHPSVTEVVSISPLKNKYKPKKVICSQDSKSSVFQTSHQITASTPNQQEM